MYITLKTHSLKQPVLSNTGKVSYSNKQGKPLLGLKLTTQTCQRSYPLAKQPLNFQFIEPEHFLKMNQSNVMFILIILIQVNDESETWALCTQEVDTNILLFLQREMCYEFTIYKFIKPTYKALGYILSFRNEGSMKYVPQI